MFSDVAVQYNLVHDKNSEMQQGLLMALDEAEHNFWHVSLDWQEYFIFNVTLS